MFELKKLIEIIIFYVRAIVLHIENNYSIGHIYFCNKVTEYVLKKLQIFNNYILYYFIFTH